MKTCSICRRSKSVDDFYRDRTKKDGRQSLCIKCQKGNYTRGNNAARVADYCASYRVKKREVKKAHKLVETAVKSGLLVPQPCRYCGDAKVDAHHAWGYADPLRVMWVCRRHHLAIEGLAPEALPATLV